MAYTHIHTNTPHSHLMDEMLTLNWDVIHFHHKLYCSLKNFVFALLFWVKAVYNLLSKFLSFLQQKLNFDD